MPNQVLGRLDPKLEEQPAYLKLTAAVDLLGVAAAVLAILVVRLVTTRQEQKNRLYLERHWGPPQPVG
ncbi:MAG: hypothetical protein QOE01_1733 [Actinomycetota bacterium]|nr:hypothetical protein [Actinomycetota bacterium]